MFALKDPNLSVPFFRSVGGLLVKVNRLDLWITSDESLVAFSILLTINSENLILPMFAEGSLRVHDFSCI